MLYYIILHCIEASADAWPGSRLPRANESVLRYYIIFYCIILYYIIFYQSISYYIILWYIITCHISEVSWLPALPRTCVR